MPLLLAPYNDAMRLGMGFNSYTQTMCIDNAVEATDEAMITSEKLSPKITTSSMLFESVSEVADIMDVSPAATITTGRMEVHGHMNAFNSAEIDDADISLMASVRVMSEITSLKGSARFLPIDGMEAGSLRFNETFGDSYISGFITGGLFISIISFIASDPDRKDKLIEAVKKGLTEPAMNLENVCKEFAIASVIQGVEVPDMNRAADVAFILRIASQFPALVAQDPQRTWAILTKYKANRSFNEWSSYEILKPLDYDGVASYTSKLFDNYMQYNRLSKKVQDIISQRDKYSQVDKPRAIPPELNALLATNTLTRHPELLPKIDILNTNLKDDLLQETVNEALTEYSRPISQQDSIVQEDPFLPSVADYTPSESSSGVGELRTPCTSDLDSCSISGRSPVLRDRTEPSADLAMRTLVPPEVWADLLPVKNDQPTTLVGQPAKTATAPAIECKKPQILAAVCGTHDITFQLQQKVIGASDHNLHLLMDELERKVSNGRSIPITTSLSILYKSTDGSMRVCSFKPEKPRTGLFHITERSQHQIVKGVSNSMRGMKLFCVIYGGNIYHKPYDLELFVENANENNSGRWPCISFNKDTVGEDHSSGDDMTGVVFYEYMNSPGIQSVVSLGGTGCVLKNQRQLADLDQERIGEDTNQDNEKGNNQLKRCVVELHKDIAVPRCSCTFERGNLKVRPSGSPFLQFANGVKFFFWNDGIFEVLDKNDEVLWSNLEEIGSQSAHILEFGRDGKLRLWDKDGWMYWPPVLHRVGSHGTLVFSSEYPYLGIYSSEGQLLWGE
ncbi:hypothetical protein FANTH_1626 [Fusarium anthophilum]|uniref:Uncharacterized protein n=1 Tax=Fusarium anthophilum TaxID=48485 RepID=A0A8H4ZW04_9HYPO|nr:hypothetical protein FANTH_1626 [Fusarium anthophilum]